jgi:hypothetical protein
MVLLCNIPVMEWNYRDCPTRQIVPMVAIAGGVVGPDELIGRAQETVEVVRAAYGPGAMLLGDRRMGKTSLLRKLEQVLVDEGFVVVSLSAETTKPETFADRLSDALRQHTRFKRELAKWTVSVDVTVRGVNLKRTGKKGSANNDDLFVWAAKHTFPDRLVVLIDEITVLVGALGSSPGEAAEFLHSLRRARQETPNLAMVFAGSIGLHHVVPDASTVNDLEKVLIGALEPCDAFFLAQCLLEGNQIDTDDSEEVASALVDATTAIPYFLHHLANSAQKDSAPLTPDRVLGLVDEALRDPLDPWDLRHYRDRLRSYYGDDAELAGACLDQYALADQLSIDELLSRLGTVHFDKRPTRDDLVVLVGKLEADHYLQKLPNSSDRFAVPIIQQAWIALRRLSQ